MTIPELRRLFVAESKRFGLEDIGLGIADRHYMRAPQARDVAWADASRHAVFILRSALKLDRLQLTALLRHELAHFKDWGASERGADRIAERIGGRPIRYGRDGIQTLGQGNRPRPTKLNPRIRERLAWRSPGDGSRFAPWVLELRGKNGVYAVRDSGSHQLLYIGESHTGRLYETLTRHFQRWGGPTSGPVYARSGVEVSYRLVPAGQAVDLQFRMIRKYRPLDNALDGSSLEEVPF